MLRPGEVFTQEGTSELEEEVRWMWGMLYSHCQDGCVGASGPASVLTG